MLTFRSFIATLLPALLAACTASERASTPPDPLPIVDSVAAAALARTPTTTGGDTVSWGYRFTPGDRFRMRRRSTSTNEIGSPRYFEGDDEILIEVETVEGDGTVTLTMTTLKNEMREKAGPEHPLVKSSYVNRTPKSRVRIDRFGEVLGGEILQYDEHHRQMKIAASRPGSGTNVVDDIKFIRHEVNEVLPHLVAPATTRIGATYRDTVDEVRRWRSITIDTTDLDEPVPGSVKRSPFSDGPTGDMSMRTINTLRPIGWIEHGGERLLRVEGTFERTEPLPPDGMIIEYRHTTEYLIRSDGAIVRAEMTGTKLRDGIFEGTRSEVMELLEE